MPLFYHSFLHARFLHHHLKIYFQVNKRMDLYCHGTDVPKDILRMSENHFRHFNFVGGWKMTSWWFQPIWKICSSNWIISPGRDEHKKIFKTTNQMSEARFWSFCDCLRNILKKKTAFIKWCKPHFGEKKGWFVSVGGCIKQKCKIKKKKKTYFPPLVPFIFLHSGGGVMMYLPYLRKLAPFPWWRCYLGTYIGEGKKMERLPVGQRIFQRQNL